MWPNPQFPAERRNPWWKTSWIIKQNSEHVTMFLVEDRFISVGHHYFNFLIENMKNGKDI